MDKSKRNLIFIGLIALASFLLTFIISFLWLRNSTHVKTTTDNTLPLMDQIELAKYDGSVSGEPIYLALNGLVYDVTAGSEFYREGGPYHYLAGKDSSNELNLIGGDIIVRKYKPIARLDD